MITENLNRHKSPNVDQIQTGLKQGVEQFGLRSINLLILFVIRTNYLRSGRNRSLHLSIRRAMKQTVAIKLAYHFCQVHTKFYPSSCRQS
jgi:hypothetical protein